MVHDTSKEVISRASGHEIPRTVWNSKYNYRIHNRRLLHSPFFILPHGGLLTVLLSVVSVGEESVRFSLWDCTVTVKKNPFRELN